MGNKVAPARITPASRAHDPSDHRLLELSEPPSFPQCNPAAALSHVLQHPPQELLELPRLSRAKSLEEPIADGPRDLFHPRVGRLALRRELDVDETPIVGATVATDEALGLETVQHPGHRAASIRDALAEIGRGLALGARRESRNDDELRTAHLETGEARIGRKLSVERREHL